MITLTQDHASTSTPLHTTGGTNRRGASKEEILKQMWMLF